jgi:ABC-type sugar transport system permease subunit
LSALAAETGRAASGGMIQRVLSRRYGAVYLLVVPAILLRAVYTLIPIYQTAALSLTNKTMYNDGRFIGLANYVQLFRDRTLIESLIFTLIYTAASVTLEIALGLVIAMVLVQQARAAWLSNLFMLLPWAMAPLLAAIVWKIMFYEDGGVLNGLLLEFGIVTTPVRWLSDANTAKVSVVVVTVWKNVSWVALIFMAGLGAVPADLHEAAAMDGANAVQRFRYITLPMLQSSFYLVLLFRGMGEVQTFEQILGLTRGGPGTATQTLAVYAYQRFFQEVRYGYGSAINMLLLALTIAIGAVFAWRLYRSGR